MICACARVCLYVGVFLCSSVWIWVSLFGLCVRVSFGICIYMCYAFAHICQFSSLHPIVTAVWRKLLLFFV